MVLYRSRTTGLNLPSDISLTPYKMPSLLRSSTTIGPRPSPICLHRSRLEINMQNDYHISAVSRRRLNVIQKSVHVNWHRDTISRHRSAFSDHVRHNLLMHHVGFAVMEKNVDGKIMHRRFPPRGIGSGWRFIKTLPASQPKYVSGWSSYTHGDFDVNHGTNDC